jgi:hypothetical protein
MSGDGQKEDDMIRALRELPVHEASSSGRDRDALRIQATARAAFVRAFEDAPWYTRIFGSAAGAVVPVALASVVGLYLFWAFAVAISLNQ